MRACWKSKARSVRARQHHYATADHSVVLQRANHHANHVANDFSHNLARGMDPNDGTTAAGS